MPTFLFVGETARDFPSSDGLHPSLTVEPGDHIDRDENPDPRWFNPVDAKPDGVPVSTAATTDNEPADPTKD